MDKKGLRIIDRMILIMLICMFGISYIVNGQTPSISTWYNSSLLESFSQCGSGYKAKISIPAYNSGGAIYVNGEGNVLHVTATPNPSIVWIFYEDGTLTYGVNDEPSCGPSISSTILSSDKSTYCGENIKLSISHNGGNFTNADTTWQKFIDGSWTEGDSIANSAGFYRAIVCLDGDVFCDTSNVLEISTPHPEIVYSIPKTSISKSVGNQSQKVVIDTIYVANSCEEYEYEDIFKTISGDDFLLDGDTITILADTEGEYSTVLTLSVAGLTETIDITGTVVSWPKCYDLKKEDNSNFRVCTNDEGDLTINLEERDYDDIGILTIPSDMEIICRDFIITGDGFYNNSSNVQIVCDGSISASRYFKIDAVGRKSNGDPYFYTTCNSNIYADSIIINYIYEIQPFSGTWLSNKLQIINGNGQDIEFPECSFVRNHNMVINANISNGVKIEGHVVSDNVSSSRKIQLIYDGTEENLAVITVGVLRMDGNVNILCGENTILNICANPVKGDGSIENKNQWNEHPNGADDIGYTSGYVLYNYGELGWNVNDTLNPITEWDLNHKTTHGDYCNIRAKEVIAAYKNYEDCMNEVQMGLFMQISLKFFKMIDSNFVWQTASETNNNYFVVEYSKNCKEWVECTDYIYSASTTGYTYTAEPTIDVNNSLFSYFRLKQVDYDGKYSYSDIITSSRVISPCDKEYENNKVQIREFGNRWFRLINGELIYCESDNE